MKELQSYISIFTYQAGKKSSCAYSLMVPTVFMLRINPAILLDRENPAYCKSAMRYVVHSYHQKGKNHCLKYLCSTGQQYSLMKGRTNFMSGFFFTFSFFKLLDVNAFAETYSLYDVVAKKIKAYVFIYPFIELALGIAFLTLFNPFITNIATLIVMSISIISVLQSVLNKQKNQCACLGAVFNLPMSAITIIEDALMIVMSTAMLIIM